MPPPRRKQTSATVKNQMNWADLRKIPWPNATRTGDVARIVSVWKDIGIQAAAIGEQETAVRELLPQITDNNRLNELASNADINVEQFLWQMEYNIPFKRDVMSHVSSWLSNEGQVLEVPIKLLIALTVFQSLSLVYVSEGPILDNDIGLLLDIIMTLPKEGEACAVLAFECLVKAKKIGYVWSKASVDKVINIFHDFPDKWSFDTFSAFIEQTMETQDPEIWSKVALFVDESIQKKVSVVKDRAIDAVECMKRLPQMLLQKDRSALLLIGHSISILKKKCDVYFWDVASAYVVWATDAATGIVAGERAHVSNLPGRVEEKPKRESRLIDGEEYQWRNLPAELVITEAELGEFIPGSFVKENKLLVEFVHFLDGERKKEFLKCFAEKLETCDRQTKCRTLTCFVSAFQDKPEMLEQCFDFICDDELFSEMETTFGPDKYDNMTNMYRKFVVHTFCQRTPLLLRRIIEKRSGCAFFLAEFAGRVWVERSFDLNVLSDKFSVISFLDSLEILRFLDDRSPARTTLLNFVFEYLKQKSRINGRFAIADPAFASSFLPLLYEKSLVDIVFEILGVFLESVSESDFTDSKEEPELLDETTKFFREYISNAPEMKEKLFIFIGNIVRMRPFFAKRFSSFLGYMVTELAETKTDTALKYVIYLLTALVDANTDYVLDGRMWQVLAGAVSEEHYTLILNLMAGSFSVTKASTMFFIQQPQFIPLMFCALGRNESKITEFFQYLKSLVVGKSLYNAYRLHDGNIDDILLTWLKEGPKIVYQGVTIEMNVNRQIVLEVLEAIVSLSCDAEIAGKFIQTIKGPKDADIITILQRIEAKSRAHATYEYPIGTLPQYAKVENVKASDIKGPFSVSFRLYTDESILSGLPAIIDVLSITDGKSTRLSLCIINNSLWALSDNKARKVLVPLCQRMASHRWTSFFITFKNNISNDTCLISTIINDGESVQDCEFEIVRFESRYLTVFLGGHDFEYRLVKAPRTVCGMVANVYLCRSYTDDNDILSLFNNHRMQLKNCIFSFTDMAQNAKVGEPVVIMKTGLTTANIFLSLRDDDHIRIIAETYMKVREPKLLGVLQGVIDCTTDSSLPVQIRDWLQALDQNERNLRLYLMFFDLAKRITNFEIRRLWLDEILLNVNIWNTQDTRLLSHWSTSIISTFANELSSGCYFGTYLCRLTDVSQEALTFLCRLGRIHLEDREVKVLFDKCHDYTNNPVLLKVYLRIVRYLADKICELRENAIEYLVAFLDFEDIDIVILTIECLTSIATSKSWFQLTAILLRKLKPTQTLVDRLLLSASEWPHVFLVFCAICVFHPELKITGNVVAGEMNAPPPLWYLYPVLLYVKSEGALREGLQRFIAANACRAKNDILDIAFFVMLVSEYSEVAFPAVHELAMTICLSSNSQQDAEELFWLMILVGLYKIRPKGYVSTTHLFEAVQSSDVFDLKPSLDTYQKKIRTYSDARTIKEFIEQAVTESKPVLEIAVCDGALPNAEFLRRGAQAARIMPDKVCVSKGSAIASYTGLIPGGLLAPTRFSFGEIAQCIDGCADGTANLKSVDEFDKNRTIIEHLSDVILEKFERMCQCLKSELDELFA